MRAVAMSPDKEARLAQFDSFAGMNVAVEPAVHDHVAGLDIGADAAVRADGQALPAEG